MRRHYVLGTALVLLALAAWSMQAAAAEQLQVTLVKLTSPVKGGDLVTLTIRTTTGAECKGNVRYKFTQGPLSSKTANDEGTVTWSWRLSPEARGSYPIDVQCTQADKRGFLSAMLEVQ